MVNMARKTTSLQLFLIILIFSLLLFLPAKVFSLDDDSKLSMFIYKISGYVGESKGDFCAYGYDGVVSSLEANDQIDVVAIKDKTGTVNSSCRMIYIAKSEEKYIKALTAKFNRKNVVTISLVDGFLENDGMVFVQVARRGNIELVLNDDKIKEYGIKVNPVILNIVTSYKK